MTALWNGRGRGRWTLLVGAFLLAGMSACAVVLETRPDAATRPEQEVGEEQPPIDPAGSAHTKTATFALG